MSLSLIKPKLKPVLSLFTKIWLMAFLFFLLLFLSVNVFFEISSYSLKKEIVLKQAKYVAYTSQIDNIKQKIDLYTRQKDIALNIYSSNSLLKKNLGNLFDLVPDAITLSNIYIDKNTLIIKGITPSKDVYRMLMEAPLKSIFNNSKTSFYQMNNGWLNFVNTNTIDSSEGFSE